MATGRYSPGYCAGSADRNDGERVKTSCDEVTQERDAVPEVVGFPRPVPVTLVTGEFAGKFRFEICAIVRKLST